MLPLYALNSTAYTFTSAGSVGRAEIIEREGHFGAAKYLRITPERSWSWGIERAAFENERPVFRRNRKK
jgi:hypothetical protein